MPYTKEEILMTERLLRSFLQQKFEIPNQDSSFIDIIILVFNEKQKDRSYDFYDVNGDQF